MLNFVLTPWKRGAYAWVPAQATDLGLGDHQQMQPSWLFACVLAKWRLLRQFALFFYPVIRLLFPVWTAMATGTRARTVLVTGGTGFIGAHVTDLLLKRGHRVVAAVRAGNKSETFAQVRSRWMDRGCLKLVTVQNMTAEGAYDSAVQGCDAAIHLASPFRLDAKDNEADLLRPAIQGTTSLLASLTQARSIERLVLTSSFASVRVSDTDLMPGHTYTEEDWSPVTYEEARDTTSPATAYRGSKALAERAAWEWMASREVMFDLVTLCPPLTFGPIVHPCARVSELNASNAELWRLAHSRTDPVSPVQRLVHWVDVRDAAEAHVNALDLPKGNHRFIFCADEIYTNQTTVDLIRHHFPWARETSAEQVPGVTAWNGYAIDNARAKRAMNLSFRPFRETLVDAISQFKQIEASE